MRFRSAFRAFTALLTLLAFASTVGAQPQPGAPAAPGAPTAPIVRAIDIQYAGAESVSRERILANIRTRVGKPYSQQAVEDDIRSLYAMGSLDNVRMFGEPVSDGVKVVIVVAGKGTVNAVELRGVSRFKPSRVRKQITVKPGDSLSPATLEADRQKILEYYTGKGFTDTDVRYTTEEEGGKTRVVFNVTEGVKTSVASTNFEGNASFKKSALLKVVKTQPKTILNFLTKAGRLDSDQLTEDVSAIREFYQNKGYIDVQVNAPRVDRRDGKVDVTFPINEGAKYTVSKISYGGPKVFPEDQVVKSTKLRPGSVYSPAALRADIKSVQDLYGSRGYVDFQAGATTSPGGANAVNIQYSLEEGAQSYTEHINIAGNVRTKDKVIRREIALEPGEVLNTVRLEASKKRLQNLNYFSKVEMYPADTLVPGRKDVNVVVEEKRTGSFNFGAGFSSIDNLLGFAEITQSNFDITHPWNFTGGGEKFRLRIQYGVERKDFVLSLTEPYFLDYKLSLGGEIFYREASFISDVYNESRAGFDLTARKALNDFMFVRFGYRIENVDIGDISDDATEEIKKEQGSTLESRLSAGITYDTRDSVFLTRKGHRVDLGAYVAGGFLGGDTQIYGFDLEGTKYFLLPGDTIFTINAEVGVVENWGGGDRVPIYDRLYAGGANNLRGFRFRDVGPKDDHDEPIGGNTLVRATLEYTFPIVEKVRGAVFYDAGWVNAGSWAFVPKKLPNGSGGFNQDVGIGFRLDLPIGPVRIDYGIPITSDSSNGSSGKFNFNIGYQF